MRRKLTLPVWPPVATMTPFGGADVDGLPLGVLTSMPSTRPLVGFSRMIRVILCLSRICAPFLRALSVRRRTSPEPLRLRCGATTSAGMCHSLVTKMRSTVEASGWLDRLLDELDAVVEQELVGRDVLVGEDADQVAVAVAALGVVGAHPVEEHLVGVVLDVELLLQRVAAAELHAPAAQHAAAADVVVLLDDDHRGAKLARRDGGGQPGDAGADDDHVGGLVPVDAPARCASVAAPPAPPRLRRAAPLVRNRSPAEILPGHGRASPIVVLLWHHLEPAPDGVKGRSGRLECTT